MRLLPLAAGILLCWVGGSLARQISSSVILFQLCEFIPYYGQSTSQCQQLLERAREGRSNRVNIVPTHYWVDDANKALKPGCYPDNWRYSQKVSSYCHKWEWDGACMPFNKTAIDFFRNGMQTCLQQAKDMGFDVLISPHLDDATKTDHWRNMVQYDPYAKDPHGYSYHDIMVAPLVDAVEAVYKDSGRTVWLGLQGEMGATVFFYPHQYKRMAQDVQARLGGGTMKVGVLLNNDFVPGVLTREILPPGEPGPGPLKPFSQWPQGEQLLRANPKPLFDVVDFIAMSNYVRVPANLVARDLEGDIVNFSQEMDILGLDVKKMIDGGEKEALWFTLAPSSLLSSMMMWANALGAMMEMLLRCPHVGVSRWMVMHGMPGQLSMEQGPIGFQSLRLYSYVVPSTCRGDCLSCCCSCCSLLFLVRLLPGKIFLVSEHGVGGGLSKCGNVTARTGEQVGKYPSLGIHFNYKKNMDPWQNSGPRDFRRRFYEATSEWLQKSETFTYRVDGLFLWNLVSWDVQGIHPASSSEEGTFSDDLIIALIQKHNDANKG